MELDKSIKSYLDDISSNSPTPGGGNVSAFSGALACSLGIMVCNLTIGKKKYADVEAEMAAVRDKLSFLQSRFITLAEEDNKAFEKVMEAFRLPKDDESQKQIRQLKIEEATMLAAGVPGEVIQTCYDTFQYLKTAADKGNQNGLSDSAVALSLLNTAAQGAFMNVLINCSSLNNKTAGNEILKRMEVILTEVRDECSNAIKEITRRLIQ